MGRSLRASALPFFIGVGLLLVSYVGSLVTRALDSYFGFVDVAALLIGVLLILIAAPLVQLPAHGQSDRFQAGMRYTGGSAALLAIWPFIVVWFVFPPGDGAHTACQDALGAGDGRILGTTRTLFPAQIHCDTTQGTSMASVYSGWESAGLSSVTVLLVAVVIFGIWLMATQGRKAA
jgi:hypothetical protein